MDSEIPILKPRYPLHLRLIIFGLPVLFFASLGGAAASLASFPAIFWLLALVLGLATSQLPFFIVREIRFLDEVVVRRHFLPDQFFTHKEFEQIGADSIQAGGQRIRLGQITNLDELKDMTQRWKAARILKEAQRLPPAKESLFPQRGYDPMPAYGV
jgi:hypothetical protein